jgi:pimeloyl-ACP methyl ester carboxylesterase
MSVDYLADSARVTDEAYWRTPQGVTRHYWQGRFGSLHYRLAGTSAAKESGKPPLICFHLTPNSSRIYNRLLSQMGHDRLVCAVDTPGFGLSSSLPFTPQIADYAAYLAEFLQALARQFSFEQVDLLGYHTGSKIAVILARQQPQLIRRIALVSAPVYTDEELQSQQRSLAIPLLDAWPAEGEPLQRRWQEQEAQAYAPQTAQGLVSPRLVLEQDQRQPYRIAHARA